MNKLTRILVKMTLCAASLLINSPSVSTQIRGAETVKREDKICGYEPIKGFNFNSNKEAQEVLEKTIKTAGLLVDRFVIMAADVDNATACEDENSSIRYILYNPSWMKGLAVSAGANTDWAKVAILAHEIGHHALGHNLKTRVSTPAIELEADEYAGKLLATMGANLEQALAAYRQPEMCNEEGSATHPKCKDRLAAVEKGWWLAHKQVPTIDQDSLKDTVWMYKQEGGVKYEIKFLPEGRYTYINGQGKPFDGMWKIEGAVIFLISSNGRETEQGVINGDSMSGTGKNELDDEWKWSAKKKQ